jgi:hypothetical protein
MYDNIHFFLHPDILHHKQVVNISLQYTFLTPCTLILHYPALHLLSLFQDPTAIHYNHWVNIDNSRTRIYLEE